MLQLLLVTEAGLWAKPEKVVAPIDTWVGWICEWVGLR